MKRRSAEALSVEYPEAWQEFLDKVDRIENELPDLPRKERDRLTRKMRDLFQREIILDSKILPVQVRFIATWEDGGNFPELIDRVCPRQNATKNEKLLLEILCAELGDRHEIWYSRLENEMLLHPEMKRHKREIREFMAEVGKLKKIYDFDEDDIYNNF